jgi:hypothetical protein
MMILFALAAAATTTCAVPQGWLDPSRPKASVSITKICSPGTICIAEPIGTGGGAFDVVLLPKDKFNFEVTPSRKLATGSFGGVLPILVSKAGLLDVAMSNRAYVDLILNRKAVRSYRQRHGCGGVAKIVSFPVKPGQYRLQFIDSPDPAMRVSLDQ